MMERGMINHWQGRSGISPLDVDPLPRVPGEGEVLTFFAAWNSYDQLTGSQFGICLIWRNHDLFHPTESYLAMRILPTYHGQSG